MLSALQLPLRFLPDRLHADLALAERSAWTDHFVTQNYEGAWSVIPLRAPAGETHPVRMIYPDPSCTEFVDTPLLAETGCFRDVLDSIRAPLAAVRLMRLGAGSVIKEHRDYDLDIEHGIARLHVPVATNPGVEFMLNGERVVMNEGECWYLRLSDPHSVANRGAADRVHLVIDATVNDWLLDAMSGASR